MKRIVINTLLAAVISLGVVTPGALAQRHGYRCRERYDFAVRTANRFRGPERRIRMAQARREYNECRRRAGR